MPVRSDTAAAAQNVICKEVNLIQRYVRNQGSDDHYVGNHEVYERAVEW